MRHVVILFIILSCLLIYQSTIVTFKFQTMQPLSQRNSPIERFLTANNKAASVLVLFFVILISACQKKMDVINDQPSLTQKRIEVTEIKQWVNTMLPTLVDQPTLLYARAEQSKINGNHFVRIPTTGKGSDGGSFYFNRRPDGNMEVNYVVRLVSDSIKGNGIVGFANLDEKSFRINVYENNKLVLSKIVPDSLGLFNKAFLSSATQIKKFDGADGACEVEQVTLIKLPNGSDSVIIVKSLSDPKNPKTGCPSVNKGKSLWEKFTDWLEGIKRDIRDWFSGGGGGGGGGGFSPYNPPTDSPIYGIDFWSFFGSGYLNVGPGGGFGVGIGGGGGFGGGGGSSQYGPDHSWGPFPIPPGMVGVMTGDLQLTDRDREILEEIQREDDEADAAYLNNPCGTTLRFGNLAWKGPIEHVMIQIDYMEQNQLYGHREYSIPYSGSSGQKPGYADIVNTLTNEIFEVKPNNPQGRAAGEAEVQNYVTKANLFCPIINTSISPVWRPGQNYQPRYLNYPLNPTLSIEAKLLKPGVIIYDYVSRNPATQPIVIPQNIADKLKLFLQEAAKNLNGITPEIILVLLQKPEYKELLKYIKTAVVGAVVAIVVGTIVEDFITAGAGIGNDVQSFLLAYKLIRIARKIPV